jgi:predicted MPP superfamily phosphohydrolase
LINEKDHHILVTSGTGNSILPVRFRVPPEIVVVEVGFKAM